LLVFFELPQPCLPLLHGKDEGCFAGKAIPDEACTAGSASPKARCRAHAPGRDVPAPRNDLSTQSTQQPALGG